jgi:hypothetical protein
MISAHEADLEIQRREFDLELRSREHDVEMRQREKELELKQRELDLELAAIAAGGGGALAEPEPEIEQRKFILLVTCEDAELLPEQRKCNVNAGNVAQLEAAVQVTTPRAKTTVQPVLTHRDFPRRLQEKLGLSAEVAVLIFDDDFEEFVLLSNLELLPVSHATHAILRQSECVQNAVLPLATESARMAEILPVTRRRTKRRCR